MKRCLLCAIRYVLLMVFLFTCLGCDAFVRKFTRQTKKKDMPAEEMVLAPEEYHGTGMSKEELYRNYLLFWQSWHDEFVTAISENAPNKKKAECLNEALKNLNTLKQMLNENKQKELDTYIAKLSELQRLSKEDIYGVKSDFLLPDAQRLRREILRDFSFPKVRDDLK